MAHVSNIFSVDELEKEIAAGYVNKREHPSLPLFILNYSERAQFDRYWNDVTLNCRGLIVDEDYNIVARPWKKFFNFGERPLLFSTDDPVEVTDKKDGSLGILYKAGGSWAISTRGSFESDQAIHATELWNRKYNEIGATAGHLDDTTFLFEIVYPKNRIVLDYGDMDDLILLGAVDKQRGYYWGPRQAAGLLDWTGPVTEVFQYRSLNECFGIHRENAEGLVIRCGSSMVKLKQEDYIALHKLVTGLNERAVWERMRDGQSAEEICEALPDEFHDWVVDVAQHLVANYLSVQGAAIEEYIEIRSSLPEDCSRKEFALKAKDSRWKAYLFNLLDGKDIEAMTWDAIKPEINAF